MSIAAGQFRPGPAHYRVAGAAIKVTRRWDPVPSMVRCAMPASAPTPYFGFAVRIVRALSRICSIR